MSNLSISQLPELTTRTHNLPIPIVSGATTYKISVENYLAEPVLNAGNVTGSVQVDLNDYSWFIFTLTGDVQVELINQKPGYQYLFWVYSTGSYAVTAMTLQSGGDVFCVGGSLPNPANNDWNLYQGYAVNGDFILTEIGNFSAI
jgi:hypothetical protein